MQDSLNAAKIVRKNNILTDWGRLLKEAVFDYCKESDEIVENPYTWAASNLTMESEKNFRRRLLQPIDNMPAILLKRIQSVLRDPKINAYIQEYFLLGTF